MAQICALNYMSLSTFTVTANESIAIYASTIGAPDVISDSPITVSANRSYTVDGNSKILNVNKGITITFNIATDNARVLIGTSSLYSPIDNFYTVLNSVSEFWSSSAFAQSAKFWYLNNGTVVTTTPAQRAYIVSTDSGPSNFYLTIPPTSEYSSVTLSQDGKSVTQNTNPANSQSLIWPISNGIQPNISVDINHATLGIRPAITSAPNVETYATVSINGVDTKYKLGAVIPDTDIPPNVSVDLSIQSTAPEITIDYNNTSAPVITNTPTGG